MTEEMLRQEEEALREQIYQLPVQQKKQYYALEVAQVKDPDTYAALNWAFVAGLHHFYLGKWLRGFFNIVLMISGIILYFATQWPLIGGGLVVFVFVIELPQLFSSEKIVHIHNNQLMKRLIKQVSE